MNIGDQVELTETGTKGEIVSFKKNDIVVVLDEFGMDYEVHIDNVHPLPDYYQTLTAYTSGRITKNENNAPHQSKKQTIVVEVDLHAEKLIGNTHGMQPIDIKNCQLREVRKTMNRHRRQKGLKIVFIHGKGQGILKQEIKKMLKKEFPNCQLWDGKYRTYGMDGATQVVIH